jgi:hypothetical protein
MHAMARYDHAGVVLILSMLDYPRSFKQSCFVQRLSGKEHLVNLPFSSGKQEDMTRKW